MLELVQVNGLQLSPEAIRRAGLTARFSGVPLKEEEKLEHYYSEVKNDHRTNGILDLEFDTLKLFEGAVVPRSEIREEAAYMPQMNIFNAFERCGGVQQILDVILKSLTNWRNKERAKRWHQFVQELSVFSALPHFFGLYMKNKECIELLFNLLTGLPDEDSKANRAQNAAAGSRRWDEEESKALKHSLQILADVFRVDNDAQIREFALDKGFVDRILERVGTVSKEERRRWVEELKEEKEEVKEQPPPEPVEKKEEDEDLKKKIVKKKGVGYASENTGQNARWNTSEYVELKKTRSEYLQSLISILETYLDFQVWQPPKKLQEIICTSALLPLLEATFRSGSLLDMSKDAELFFCQLRLVRVISRHHGLIPCLLDLDAHYQPRQTDSVYALIRKLNDTAHIFLTCLNTKNDPTQPAQDTNRVAQQLAEDIQLTFNIVDEAVAHYREEEGDDDNDADNLEATLALPLPQKYRILLQDLRFDYISMKDANSRYKHHYAT